LVNGRRKSEDSDLLASGLKVRPPLNGWGEGARRVRERSGAIRHGGWGVELRLYQTFCIDDANINLCYLFGSVTRIGESFRVMDVRAMEVTACLVAV
jgi:hypothetical protein